MCAQHLYTKNTNKHNMQKTYKYRLYPSKKQIELLNNTLETCKKLYNHQLAYEKYVYIKEKRFANKLELNNILPDLKIINSKLKLVHSQILQNVNDRVTKTFQNFFNRIKKEKIQDIQGLKVHIIPLHIRNLVLNYVKN